MKKVISVLVLISVLIFSFGVFLVPSYSNAKGILHSGSNGSGGILSGFGNSGGNKVEIKNPLKWDSFTGLLNAIIDFLFNISLGVAPIMIIVAGFYFITAEGDPEKVKTAKQIILWTLVGLLVIIGAKGLIALFGQIFGVQTPYNTNP